MTLYFHSPNEFPLETVSIVGLSAKLNDTSIGRFGTGMKYAIAVILRLGGSVVLLRDGQRYLFETRQAELRGKPYNQIWMLSPKGELLLPFTTDYGRDWKPWQAYRELFSNCLDEGGDVSRTPFDARTCFIVEGLDEVYEEHDSIFLPRHRKPAVACDRFELYSQPSSFVYYRGIRVWDSPKELEMSINILSLVTLTEDRTIAYMSAYTQDMAKAIASSPDSKLISACVTNEALDEFFAYRYMTEASETFVSTVTKSRFAKPHAQLLANAVRKEKTGLKTVEPTLVQEFKIKAAVTFVSGMIPELQPEDVFIAEDIGRALGVYSVKEDRIYLSQRILTMSKTELRATLLEEAVHKYRRLRDESRELQSWLFAALITERENYLEALA